MIFSPELARKVLRGEKNMARRRLTHRDGKPIRYRIGGVYAVQPGRGRPHVGHIKLLVIEEEPLHLITPYAAQREGFETEGDFIDYWMRLHGSWNPHEEVAVLDFVRAPDCPKCVPLEEQP